MPRYLPLLVISVVLAIAASSTGTPTESPNDIVQIYQLQADFHQAASTKNIEQMMSLWADDATFVLGDKTYTGKSQIREWFATVSGAFKPQNHWVSLAPAFRTRINVQGDRATLYYECHYADVATKEIKAQVTADSTLVRIGGKWLFKSVKAGQASL